MPPENKHHCLLMLDDQKSQYIIPSNKGKCFYPTIDIYKNENM